MSDQGISVPTRATFGGGGIFRSRATPGAFRLYSDRVELDIMGTIVLALADIEQVDVRTTFLTNNVSFALRGRRGKPTANVRRAEDRQAALRYLAERGVTLSERAQRLLDD